MLSLVNVQSWNSSLPSFAGKLAELTEQTDAALRKGIIFRCCTEIFSVLPTRPLLLVF